jgi:hypothetical protein
MDGVPATIDATSFEIAWVFSRLASLMNDSDGACTTG